MWSRQNTIAVAALLVVLAALGWITWTLLDEGDGKSGLAVFEREATAADEQASWVVGNSATVDDGPFELPEPHLPGSLDMTTWLDPAAARRVAARDDMAVYAVPIGPPVGADLADPETTALIDGLLINVHVTGVDLSSTVPVPARGDAVWAGTIHLDGTPYGVVVVGNGLDQVVTEAGTRPVRDNGVIVEGLEDGGSATFLGPAGETTITAEAAS